MNIEVIRAAVNIKPEELDMDNWALETACGTVGCIAGNCVIQYYRKIDIDIDLDEISSIIMQGFRLKAQKLMDLTDDEADRLFFSSRWPHEFTWGFKIRKAGK